MGSTDKRTIHMLVLILVLATVAAYSGAYKLGFTTLDDPSYVTKNPHIADGLTREGIGWALTGHHSANWHPLTWVSHMLDVELYGLSPAGHHITNVTLHILNTLLLFALLSGMTGLAWRSAFVAAVFGLHPLHVESVAWVSERKDVLSTMFWMLTMLAYVRYVRGRDGSRPLRWYALVVALFALGLMAKPMLVTLPIVLILLDWWPLGRYGNRGVPTSPDPSFARRGEGKGTSPTLRTHRTATRPSPRRRGSSFPNPHPPIPIPRHLSPVTCHLVEKLPLFALAAASCAVTFWAQHGGGAVRSMAQYPLGVRAANAVVAYLAYIGKTFWPTRLSAIYPHPEGSLPMLQVALSAALLVAITWAVVRLARTKPYLAVGWFWYAITLIPVIGLVQVGQQAMADRYTYVPMIGLLIMLAWGVPDLLARLGSVSRAAVAVPAVLVLAALSVATWLQVGHWRDGVALLQHSLASTSGHPMVHYCLADAYLEEDNASKAAEHYLQALSKKPGFAEAHNGLGRVYLSQGRSDDAAREFEAALRLDPRLSSAHNNLGHILLMRGRVDEARRRFSKAVALDPRNAEALANFGTALDRLGETENAARRYRSALAIDPHLAEARLGLGSIHLREGDIDAAEAELSKAVELKPGLAEARFYLANVLGKQGDIAGAIAELKEVLRLRPRWGLAHYTLSAAYYQAGDVAAALAEARLARKHGTEPSPAYMKALEERAGQHPAEDGETR